MQDHFFIDPKNLELRHDPQDQAQIWYHRPDENPVSVEPRRLFPMTKPDAYIRIVDQDEAEIGILRHVRKLRRSVRDEVQKRLQSYYFIPCIVAIHAIEEEYGISSWQVTTDHGPREFDVRNRSTDIIIMENRRLLIKDADHNTYEIPDHGKLPPKSQALLDGEI